MYTKEEASKLRQAFWTAFGNYISPHLSAEGLKVNWINYKTGIKYIFFRMKADHKAASIAIELMHPDKEIQELFFDQFLELKTLFLQYMQEEWTWSLHDLDEHGKTFSRIYKELSGVNVLNKNDWPKLISFFKPRIISLDEFWSDAKYIFDSLK